MIERLNKKRGEEGFTLIELLIVIVILGILAAIVVFAVGGTGGNAAVAACKSDAASLETALEAYKAQQSPPAYPQSPSVSQSSADPGWSLLLAPSKGSSNTPYLRTVPPTVHYQLWWDANGVVYVLKAAPTAYPPSPAPTASDSSNFDSSNGAACSVAS